MIKHTSKNNKMKKLSEYMKYQKDLKHAKDDVSVFIKNAENFKIGKTGKTTEERFAEPDYNGLYDNIVPIFSSGDADTISRMEADLISEFKDDPKCDNERTTDQDDMADSDKYIVYLIWK